MNPTVRPSTKRPLRHLRGMATCQDPAYAMCGEEAPDVNVLFGLLGGESAAVAQEVDEAGSDAAVDVEDEVLFLLESDLSSLHSREGTVLQACPHGDAMVPTSSHSNRTAPLWGGLLKKEMLPGPLRRSAQSRGSP